MVYNRGIIKETLIQSIWIFIHSFVIIFLK